MKRFLSRAGAGLLIVLIHALALQNAFATDVMPGRNLVIENVAILPMKPGGRVLNEMTVTVIDGRITSMVRSKDAKVVDNITRISGRGKWLMPALTDMHTHLENDRLLRLYMRQPDLPDGLVKTEDALLPYLANGVLQIFVMSGMTETMRQQGEVENSRVLGPRIAMAAMIDGGPPMLPEGMTRVATTHDAGRAAVRAAAQDGFDIIKVYSRIDLDTFNAIVDEARRLNMRVIGHIPQRNKGITAKFFQPGYSLVAHAEEFAQQTAEPSEKDIPRFVMMAKRNGTALVATLTLDDRILEQLKDPASLERRPEIRFLNPALQVVVLKHNPYVGASSPAYIAQVERIIKFNKKLVHAFANAGIPVLAGTDAPVPGIVPGFSLHDELEALVAAGMTNEQALASATRLPAQWLGVSRDRGTIAVGKQADLLLLDANPLVKITNTRRIAAVITKGHYLPRSELDGRMQELATRFAPPGDAEKVNK